MATRTGKRRYPGATWLQYVNLEAAEWSTKRLAKARRFADRIGSSAVMVIDDGAVVAA